MTAATTPQNEERAARDRAPCDRARPRRQGQGRRPPARRRSSGTSSPGRARKACRCPITPDSTLEELRALGAGCTAGRWVCPTLDAIRRRLGA